MPESQQQTFLLILTGLTAYLWSQVSRLRFFSLIWIEAADWHTFKLLPVKDVDLCYLTFDLWTAGILSAWGVRRTDLCQSDHRFDLQLAGKWVIMCDQCHTGNLLRVEMNSSAHVCVILYFLILVFLCVCVCSSALFQGVVKLCFYWSLQHSCQQSHSWVQD